MRIALGRRGAPFALAGCASMLAVGLSACGSGGEAPADLVAGKQVFVEKCGACHTLSRAGTKGTTGPNLDDAFRQALADGMNRATVRGTVWDQVLHPATLSTNSPAYMPPKLAEGRDAVNVAAYVAAVTGKRGQDTGALATAVKAAGGGQPAVAKAGVLQIDADPNGQLAYVTDKASATAGTLEIRSKNASQVDHDIAVEVDGATKAGEVVKDGGTSVVKVDLKPGKYTYFCTVAGHRAAGMQGTLTVK